MPDSIPIVACHCCGLLQAVPAADPGMRPVCGRCGTGLRHSDPDRNRWTVALALSLAGLLFLLLEVLAGGLGELGNVRFQGLLEDNPGLLPAGAEEEQLQLSRVLDAIRWGEILVLSVIWILTFFLWGGDSPWRLGWGIAVPLAAALLAVMVVVSFVNVLGRYLFHYSLAFTEEVTINLFVWVTVPGSGIAFERGSHLGMITLFRLFPRRFQQGLLVLLRRLLFPLRDQMT